MKPIIDRMKDVGASGTTINLFMVLTMLFFFILGVGLLFIMGYGIVVRNEQPSPQLYGALTGIIGILGTIFAIQHTTVALNTTQTNTVHEQQLNTKPIIDASAQSTLLLAQALQQTLASMSEVNATQARSASDTATALTVQKQTEQQSVSDTATALDVLNAKDIPTVPKENSNMLLNATRENTSVTVDNTEAVKELMVTHLNTVTLEPKNYERG